jgi:DNA-binding LacI/PurR family transcriptional regulator
MSKPVTAKTIARAAGVSLTTVSHVINGRAARLKIKPATQQRVLDLVRQTGYVPDTTLREILLGHRPLIGLFLPPDTPQAARFLASLEPALAAARCRIQLVALPADPGVARARAEELARDRAVAMVCWAADTTDPAAVQAIAAVRPTLVLGRPLAGLPAVYEDGQDGGRRLAARLLDRGHRAIAIVNPENRESAVVAGFREACGRAGLQPRVLRSAGEFMAVRKDCTAVFCATGPALADLYVRAAGAGVRIPADLSVVAADAAGVAAALSPQPTVLCPGRADAGAAAARLVLQMIRTGGGEQTRLDPVLIDGQSVGAPASRVVVQPVVPVSAPPVAAEPLPVAVPPLAAAPAPRPVPPAPAAESEPAPEPVPPPAEPSPPPPEPVPEPSPPPEPVPEPEPSPPPAPEPVPPPPEAPPPPPEPVRPPEPEPPPPPPPEPALAPAPAEQASIEPAPGGAEPEVRAEGGTTE